MKLKTVFIVFNVIIVLSFLFVFFLPAMFLGWEYTTVFWRGNWYLAVLFLAVLVVLNLYFGVNWRLFTALEAEDWASVITVLESRLESKRRITGGNVRLLINAYVVNGKPERIRELEVRVRAERPQLVRKHALLFGLPYILGNNGAEIAAFFAAFRSDVPTDPWVEWYYAFGLMMEQSVEEAATVLKGVAARKDQPVVQALSLYLLDAMRARDAELEHVVDEGKSAFLKRMERAAWLAAVERGRGEVHVLVLSKLLNDVGQWLYGGTQ